MKKGQLYIISAPSGAGKTSLLNALRGSVPYIRVSVSHTTRDPRPGETDGWHYHFVSKQEFESSVAGGEFLEHAKVFDNYYGTSKKLVLDLLTSGSDVILEIDWQGARLVRETIPDLISIFILPPSLKALEARLIKRQQDTQEVIARRMEKAQSEMAHWEEYDYLIVNDDFEDAHEDLRAIFRGQRLRSDRQKQHHEALLKNLQE